MAQRFIGVDVGGTKVVRRGAGGHELSEPTVRPTVLDSSEGLIDQLAELIEAAGPADAVGIGVPSVIDFATGTARHSVNVPLQDVPLRRILTERLKLPVFVDNDATVAALAEAHDDDLNQIAQSLILFTIGTGVGGGIVIGGRIYRGATGGAAELGHQLVGADLSAGAPPHSDEAPQPGSLERLAAGRALDALGRERGFDDGPRRGDRARAPGMPPPWRRSTSSASGSASASPTPSTSSTPSRSSSAAASAPPASCCWSPRARSPGGSCCRAWGPAPRSASPATGRGPASAEQRFWPARKCCNS